VALQNDERANYQLDVKFQESYLSKVVALLQCQLSEGAASNKDTDSTKDDNNSLQGSCLDEIEEGELPDCHGEYHRLFVDTPVIYLVFLLAFRYDLFFDRWLIF